MKKYLLILSFFLPLSVTKAYAQCTPVNCLSTLPPYGGLCDTSIMNGRVNDPYYDFISFHITTACVDAGTLDPQYSGIYAKMMKLHDISFAGLPAGLTGATSQPYYNAPANGCASLSGTPSQAGVFSAAIHMLVDIRTWPVPNCPWWSIYTDENNNAVDGTLDFIIFPDPSYAGLDSVYCINDPCVALTPVGTTGGTFSGPGVSGSTFCPAVAGAGTFYIKYEVSAQQGAATGPATDSLVKTVTVLPGTFYHIDQDGDAFGNGEDSALFCTPAPPPGYANNPLDCNDTNALINPNTAWFADADSDLFINPLDSLISCLQPAHYILPSSSAGIDCNDTNAAIGPPDMYYQDADGDSYGNPAVVISSCTQPPAYVMDSLDCNDLDSLINPATVWFADVDGDHYFNPADSVTACEPAGPYILMVWSFGEDCNDTNALINPGQIDIPDNGIDENCSGSDSTSAGVETEYKGKISVFPNPARDLITLRWTDDYHFDRITLMDMPGRRLEEYYVKGNSVDIILHMLLPGIYFFKLQGSDPVIIRVMKK